MAAPSDFHDILQVLQKKSFKPNVPVERQVASHVRELIRAKKLEAHLRLPPIRMLAELWDTNYFAVQGALSRLAGEGLIVQSPKKGSFIAPQRRGLSRACLYHNQNLSSDWQLEFYSLLNIWLYRILSERGIVSVPYFDHRPENKMHIAPPEVRDMAKDGEIDAVIATSIYPKDTPWLIKLEVPVASLALEEPHGRIYVDSAELARLAIEEAVRYKRKSIGLIHRPESSRTGNRNLDELRAELERLGAKNGISVLCPEDEIPIETLTWEKYGFVFCEWMLKQKKRPDMVLVYPDVYIRGVAASLMKHRVRVPKNILLVSYRNEESSIYLPFPMTWLTVKIESYARALLEQIDRQIKGNKLLPVMIPLRVQHTVPQ